MRTSLCGDYRRFSPTLATIAGFLLGSPTTATREKCNMVATPPGGIFSLFRREKITGERDPAVTTDRISAPALVRQILRLRCHGAARALFERALKVCESALGPDHPNTKSVRASLARLAEAEGRSGQSRDQ
jgi:hypothetical protein